MTLQAKVERLRTLLAHIESTYAPAALASSLGIEDMVLTHLIATEFPGIGLFTLDTGRLHVETTALLREIQVRYLTDLAIYRPEAKSVADYVLQHGHNGFYNGIEQRKACCHLRKVEPLGRALAGKTAWLTGLRREQAASRRDLAEQEFDAVHGIAKFNPLLDWTSDDVWAFIRANDVPYNPLHDRGYPSIGCEPCTRAIKPGEDPRAGRWWWEHEDAGKKECGLHISKTPIDSIQRKALT